MYRCSTMLRLAFFGIITLVSLQQASAGNILGVFMSTSPSHLIIHMSVVKALAEQGHNVTVVSSLNPKVMHPNIKSIVIPLSAEQKHDYDLQVLELTTKKNFFTMVGAMLHPQSALIRVQYELLSDARFTTLYDTLDTKFDLLIMGYFMNDFQLAVAAKFNCPVIVSWMSASFEITNNLVGNPRELTYVPTVTVAVKPGERMTFLQRVQNTIHSVFVKVALDIADLTIHQFYYSKLLENDKRKLPSMAEMRKNVSLVFCNNHFSEGPVRPFVPALVEIGGIQIKEQPDELPQDIAAFLDNSAAHGAILFSLGSNLRGNDMNADIVEVIYKTLASLKQNVIWKWDDESKTPGNARNILYKSWLPQDDILAHPNLKLFITHAGKGGIVESQFHGVPMLALPMFGDQRSNADKMVSSGFGLQLEMSELTVESFKAGILAVLENPKYAYNVVRFSQLYRDRPLTAKQSVVYWSEYVMRHHGATHIQSPLVHLTWWQSMNLDVIGVLGLVLYVCWRILALICSFLFTKLCRNFLERRQAKKTTNAKHKKQKKY